MGLSLFLQKPILVLFIGVFIIFPFTLFRDVKFLSFPSSFSVFGVLYFVVFTVAMAIYTCVKGESQFFSLGETPQNGVGKFDDFFSILFTNIKFFLTNCKFFQSKSHYIFNFSVNALGIPTFLVAPPMIAGAFTSPPYILTIIGNLKNKTKPRVTFAIVMSFIAVWAIYTSMGVSGVITFGTLAKDDLLSTYSNTNIFASIGRGAFAFVVGFAFILVFFVLRVNLKSLFFPKHSDDYPLWIFMLLTFIPFLIIILGGMALDSVSLLLSFMGSLNGSTTLFILPGLLAWKIYRSWIGKVSSIVLILIGFFMLTGGLASSFSNLIIFIMTLFKN